MMLDNDKFLTLLNLLIYAITINWFLGNRLEFRNNISKINRSIAVISVILITTYILWQNFNIVNVIMPTELITLIPSFIYLLICKKGSIWEKLYLLSAYVILISTINILFGNAYVTELITLIPSFIYLLICKKGSIWEKLYLLSAYVILISTINILFGNAYVSIMKLCGRNVLLYSELSMNYIRTLKIIAYLIGLFIFSIIFKYIKLKDNTILPVITVSNMLMASAANLLMNRFTIVGKRIGVESLFVSITILFSHFLLIIILNISYEKSKKLIITESNLNKLEADRIGVESLFVSITILFSHFLLIIILNISYEKSKKLIITESNLNKLEADLKHNEEIRTIYNEMIQWKHDWQNHLNIAIYMLREKRNDEAYEYLYRISKGINFDRKYKSFINQWKHDWQNHLNIAIYMLREKRNDEAYEYLYRISKGINFDRKYKSFIKSDNTILEAIINSKIIIAIDNNINVNTTIDIKEHIYINDLDLCGLLGNLLDNAIEACERIERGRFINIKIISVNSNLIIVIQNSMDGNINFNGNKYYSSKRNGVLGRGISQINKIVDKYDGVVYRKYSNCLFETKIVMGNVDKVVN